MKHKVLSINLIGPAVSCPRLGKTIGVFTSSGYLCKCGKHISDKDGTK